MPIRPFLFVATMMLSDMKFFNVGFKSSILTVGHMLDKIPSMNHSERQIGCLWSNGAHGLPRVLGECFLLFRLVGMFDVFSG